MQILEEVKKEGDFLICIFIDKEKNCRVKLGSSWVGGRENLFFLNVDTIVNKVHLASVNVVDLIVLIFLKWKFIFWAFWWNNF